MTEAEEFEFRHRLETEQAKPQAGGEPIVPTAPVTPAAKLSAKAPGVYPVADYIQDNAITPTAKVLGKAADYLGGFARGGVYSLLSPMTGKQVTTPKDLGQAAMANAPTSSEYLSRMGVPEGGKLSDIFPHAKGSPIDFSLRDAAGLASDTALNPLNFLSFVSKAGGALKKLGKPGEALAGALEDYHNTNPIYSASPNVSLAIRQNALKDVDRSYSSSRAFRKDINKHLFSELDQNNRILPGQIGFAKEPGDLEKAYLDYKDKTLGGAYNDIYDSTEANKVPIDIQRAAQAVAPDIAENKRLGLGLSETNAAERKLQQDAARPMALPGGFQGPGVVTPRESKTISTGWSNSTPPTSGSRFVNPDEWDKIMQAAAGEQRNLTDQSLIGAGVPGAEKLPEINRAYSIMEAGKKPFNMLRKKAEGVKSHSQIDAGMLGTAAAAMAAGKPAIAAMIMGGLATKRAFRYMNSLPGGIATANTVQDLGNLKVWDKLLKQGAMNQALEGNEQ